MTHIIPMATHTVPAATHAVPEATHAVPAATRAVPAATCAIPATRAVPVGLPLPPARVSKQKGSVPDVLEASARF